MNDRVLLMLYTGKKWVGRYMTSLDAFTFLDSNHLLGTTYKAAKIVPIWGSEQQKIFMSFVPPLPLPVMTNN